MMHQTNLCRTYLIVLLFSIWCFIPEIIYAQNIVSVNNLTGTANAGIPIYNVSVGDISSPVSLSYNASGLKVEDYDNSCGLGWRLVADAAVRREVRGFPDDIEYQRNSSYSVIKGWIRAGNSARQAVQGLSFGAVNSNNSCATEISNASAIANNLPYYYDSEPDNFNVGAPGLSCSFVFDASAAPAIKISPYRDYIITPTTDANGKITAFTVINEKGIKYYFDKPNNVLHYIDQPYSDPSNIPVLKRDFLRYQVDYNPSTGNPVNTVNYNDEWALSKIEDTKGNTINYNYEYYTVQNPAIYTKETHQDIEILKPNGNGTFIKTKLYGVTRKNYKVRLLSISTMQIGYNLGVTPVIQFEWVNPDGGIGTPIEDKKLKTINLLREKKVYELLYTEKFYTSWGGWYGYGRYFLNGLKQYKADGFCPNVNTQFDFTYYNVNELNHTCYCNNNAAMQQYVDTIINAQDYWGYFNGHYDNPDLTPKIYVYPDNPPAELFKVYPNPNLTPVVLPAIADRSVNPAVVYSGSLQKITYPTGATTELEYESNEFFDADVNGNVQGAGIRIKKITNNDGTGTIPDVTEYSYNEPLNTALTTGRAISVPKFAVAFQNTTNYGNITDRVFNSVYRTTHDLNNEPKDVLYGKVTVKRNGIGKSVYEFNTSGTFRSTALADWDESKNYVARTNLSSPPPCTAIAPSFLYNNNAVLQYPFAPNANYDFERGLPIKVTHYNNSDQVVASEEYAYERSHQTPEKIYGARVDEIGNTMTAYAKYPVNTVVDNFITTKTSRLYNSNSSTPVVDVETYNYTPKNSTLPYRVLNSMEKQNSDGSTLRSTYKYAKEYNTVTGGDEMNAAIADLNSKNINQVIETIQDRMDGSGAKTIGASINYFKSYPIGLNNNTTRFLPSASYNFVSQAGVSNFVPSAISSGNFVKDNNYINAPTKIENYSANGLPLLITDNSHIPKTIVTSLEFGNMLAEFTNASPENVAHADFDYESAVNFNLGSGSTVEAGGRYSTNCLKFQPGTMLCRSLDKSPTAKNFIVSFWAKDAQGKGYMYLCIPKFGGTCGGPFTCSTGFSVRINLGSEWKYYQFIVP